MSQSKTTTSPRASPLCLDDRKLLREIIGGDAKTGLTIRPPIPLRQPKQNPRNLYGADQICRLPFPNRNGIGISPEASDRRGSAGRAGKRIAIFSSGAPVTPSQTVDIREEDASLILLRVIDHADLPNAQEALRVRVENAACQRGATRFAQNCEHVD